MIHISKRHFEPQPLFSLTCCFAGVLKNKEGTGKTCPFFKTT
jgi:hypothetical protein